MPFHTQRTQDPAGGSRNAAGPGGAAPLATAPGNDAAVSPVIGMILILAVSIVGITSILYWGLPAIDDMKANVEVRSVETQFRELDADIKELVAGTAGKTAKRWEPTFNRGQLAVDAATERWAVLVDVDKAKNRDFRIGDFSDADNILTLANEGDGVSNWEVRASEIQGSTTKTLNVCLSDAKCDMVAQASVWDSADGAITFYLSEDAAGTYEETKFFVDQVVVRLEIWDGAELAAEVWVMDLGRVHYSLASTSLNHDVIAANGGVFSGANDDFALLNTPPIPPPRESGGKFRFFIRTIETNGTGSFGGAGRFGLLLNLYSTTTLASLECKSGDTTTCARDAKIYVVGRLEDAWKAYFTGGDFNFPKVDYVMANSVSSESTTYFHYVPKKDGVPVGMAYTHIHSVVRSVE